MARGNSRFDVTEFSLSPRPPDWTETSLTLTMRVDLGNVGNPKTVRLSLDLVPSFAHSTRPSFVFTWFFYRVSRRP